MGRRALAHGLELLFGELQLELGSAARGHGSSDGILELLGFRGLGCQARVERGDFTLKLQSPFAFAFQLSLESLRPLFLGRKLVASGRQPLVRRR